MRRLLTRPRPRPALPDPTRRAILARLADGEATVNELAEPFDISLQAISRHLKVLERATQWLKAFPAMTDTTIEITRTFDAPRQLVWNAWTDPDQFGEWFGPGKANTTMDLKPGGEWRCGRARLTGPGILPGPPAAAGQDGRHDERRRGGAA